MENLIATSGPILVAGGCGSLGRAIVQDLLQRASVPANHIHVFDVAALPAKDQPSNVTYHIGDISDSVSFQAAITSARPAVIIHVASPPVWSKSLEFFVKINVTGTRNILSSAMEAGTKALVYTSSSSVVHDTVSDMCDIDESAPMLFAPEQPDPYLHSKAVAEMMVRGANSPSSSSKPGLLTCALRPSTLFGPHDRIFVDPLVDNARNGVYNIQVGDGKNLFATIYIDNAARAHVLAAEKLLQEHAALQRGEQIAPTKRVNGEAFFISDDEIWPFWKFVRAVGAAAEYPTDESKVTVLPLWVGLLVGIVVEWMVWIFSFGRRSTTVTYQAMKYPTLIRTFDTTKAKERLSFEPQVGIEDGIRRSTAKFRRTASS